MARKALIQLRRDSNADWSSTNPTLAEGEPTFETDTGVIKVGDGSSNYNDLPIRSSIDIQYSDYNVHLISGVIRYYASKPGWDILENQGEGHAAINIESIDTDTAKIRINYDDADWGATRLVSSFVVVPDETLALEGVTCGASVGNEYADITLYGSDVTDYIYYSEGEWHSLRGYYTPLWDTNHLELSRNPVTYLTSNFSFPQVTERNGGYNVRLGSLGKDYTEVYFYNDSGSLITVEDTAMKFYISDPNTKIKIAPSTNIPDRVGDLWIYGVILSK